MFTSCISDILVGMIATASTKNTSLLPASEPPGQQARQVASPRLAMVFWETTVACNLTCAHCRRLETQADQRQLTTTQGIDLIDRSLTWADPC
jgi:hypothetical protein